MSIFSHIRKSRQQAKEHNAKVAEQKKKESDHAPYKHVPTHAAVDAFASAPPSYREADRPRIIEQNRRRSAMAASGHHMNMPGVPRIGSSLARVSFPGEDVAPMVRMPRAYSYAGMSPYLGSARNSREVVYSLPDMTYQHSGTLKGKEVPRVYDSQAVTPASSKGDPSPVESSNGSTSSQDDLEMKASKGTRTRSSDGTIAHRLHPSRSRRTSDASVNQYTSSNPSRSSTSNYTRDSRPPPSMRGFGSIPAIAAMQPVNMGVLPGAIAAHGHANQVGQNGTSSATSIITPTSRQGSSTSLPGLSNIPMNATASAPATPSVTTIHNSEYPINWISIPGVESDTTLPSVGSAVGPSVRHGVATVSNASIQATGSSDNHTVQARLYQTMQQRTWEAQALSPAHQRFDQNHVTPLPTNEDLVNVFPEQAGSDVATAKSSKSKSKKLSKTGGGKLKKTRWSSSKAPAVAV